MDSKIIGKLSDILDFPGLQINDSSCAIRCQEFLLELYKNTDYDSQYLLDTAVELGIYSIEHGTRPADVGKLLEHFGIPVYTQIQADILCMAEQLASGHKIIVGLDADELWGEQVIDDNQSANHAVVVAGIDTRDSEDIRVIISDPGTGESAASYPLLKFLDAWQDSNFFMMSTTEPPCQTFDLPEYANFDYEAGHIPWVGDLSFDTLLNTTLTEFTDFVSNMAEAVSGLFKPTPTVTNDAHLIESASPFSAEAPTPVPHEPASIDPISPDTIPAESTTLTSDIDALPIA